ncbi:MAG: hypothetical protein GY722_28720 [bacterium]|nr:hypothetical protein [bacterium]
MTLAVFFPSLMGVGIIISGTLLVSDWLRKLFPKGNVRRQHNVVIGTYGAVGDAIDAAGYRLVEPWFVNRGLRRRSTYALVALLTAAGGAISIWVGRLLYDDPLGLFYRSPWAVGIGYGVAAALFLVAVLCVVIATVYESLPRPLMFLIRNTSIGRIVLPTRADHAAAIDDIAKER